MPILTPEERVGTQLHGKYLLERLLGKGGFGAVFAGLHLKTQRPVAVKILLPHQAKDGTIVRRFFKEAEAAGSLAHKHIVDVLDCDEDEDDTAYMVLELLRGEPLSGRLRAQSTLSVAETACLLLPIIDALQTAHDARIIHLDLKPDNIFLAKEADGVLVPKLLDFGIAKVAPKAGATLTKSGLTMGTPYYMSPEQIRGRDHVGPAADQWSMGVILFRCLSGRRLYDGPDHNAVLASILTEPVPDVSRELGAGPIAELIQRCVRRKPEERFASMAELGDRLAALVERGEAVRAAGAAAPPARVRTQELEGGEAAPELRPPASDAPQDASPAALRRASAAVLLAGLGALTFAAVVFWPQTDPDTPSGPLVNQELPIEDPAAADPEPLARAEPRPDPVAEEPTVEEASEVSEVVSDREPEFDLAETAPPIPTPRAARTPTARRGRGTARTVTAGDPPPAPSDAPEAAAEREPAGTRASEVLVRPGASGSFIIR